MEIKRTKVNTISKWRCSGVIYDDWDELYYIYIRTLKCSHCNKEFNNSYERCLDHDHITGLFRAIVCRGCNNHDRYIKYPDGYDEKLYYKKNKEKIAEQHKLYREENKEKIAEKNKEYREENKEKLKKIKKEYYQTNKENITKKYTCECGGKYIHINKQRHLKTIKHIAWFMEQVD